MHSPLLVIGENPVERATKLITPMGTTDWAGIGGRYTGHLAARPGATSAVVYGDTIPAVEAALSTMMPEGSEFRRMGPQRGAGYDQMRAGDLNPDASMTPAQLLDEHDVLHGPGLTPEEEALGMMISMYHRLDFWPGANQPDEDEVRAYIAKVNAWERRVREIIAALPDDVLVTMVDVHV